eukprot:evm.model.scf_3941.1 EVM.evm.TU.scf_3941.1   scf_3941:4725-6348(-)
MRLWLACAFILALACVPRTAVGQAEDGEDDGLGVIVVRETLADAVFLLYHEIGHALGHLLDLPVVGSEEDAVDGFAVVQMIANRSGEYDAGMVADVSRVWNAFHERGVDSQGSVGNFFGVHGLDLQRHFAVVCLLVGSDPQGQRQFAIEAGMPEERIEECRGDYARVSDAWERLLEPHAPNASRPASRVRRERRDGEIKVVYEEPTKRKKKAQGIYRDLVMGSGLVETVVEDVMSLVSLPKDLPVIFKSCGFADFSPFFSFTDGKPEVVMCYEYLIVVATYVIIDMAKRSETVVEHRRIFPNMTLEEEKTAIFVLGNTLFAVYHELATALAHDLDLPIVTDVADAADGFAAISMTPEEPDDFHDQLLVAAAAGWYLAGSELLDSELAFYSGDGLDKQRFFAVLCLFVGSDPESLFVLGEGLKFPLAQAKLCGARYYQPMVDGWEQLLRPHAPSPRGKASGEIGLVYEEVGVKAHAGIRNLVRDSGLVEEAIDNVMAMVGLPRDLQVAFMDCKDDGTGDDLTFFDADGGRVVICYSFLARLE